MGVALISHGPVRNAHEVPIRPLPDRGKGAPVYAGFELELGGAECSGERGERKEMIAEK